MFVYLGSVSVVSLNGICSWYPWLVSRVRVLSAFLIKQTRHGLVCSVWCVCGVSLCFFFSYFTQNKNKKLHKRKQDKERERASHHRPGASSHYLHNAMLNSKHCSLVPAGEPWSYYVANRNIPSSCINLPLNPKKNASAARCDPEMSNSVLGWGGEIMQRTNLLAEVINHKLFCSYSQSTG